VITELTRTRIRAIDALRGLTILVMVFVNQLAGVTGVPAWARHMPAGADAMSFVDVVFPAFLFIVGMSIPFAFEQRLARGDDGAALQRHVLGRTLGLVVLGLFMVNAEEGFNPAFMPLPIAAWSLAFYACAWLVWGVYGAAAPGGRNLWRSVGVLGLLALADAWHGGPDGRGWMTHQWWGILGLIGWSYLIAASAYLACRGRVAGLLAATAGCVAFFALGQALRDAPWPGLADLLAERAMVCETSLTLLGCVTSLLFFGRPQGGPSRARRFGRAALLLAGLVVAGAALRPAYGISKIWGTPTWCLYSAAICIVLFAALHWWVDLRGRSAWVRLVEPAAANPLVAYLIPFVIEALLDLLHLELPPALAQGASGVAFCVAYALAVLGATALIGRRVRLQL